MSTEPTQIVHSPEQVALHFPVAGPTSRMLAYAIDLTLILLLELGMLISFALLAPVVDALGRLAKQWAPQHLDPKNQQEIAGFVLVVFAVALVVQLVVEWSYFSFFELTMGGRSPGKRVLGLRVLRDGGLPITARESLLRNLMRAVDMLPAQYLVGLTAIVMSNEGKRLGDLVAGTIVVRTDAAPAPRALPEAPAAASAFRFERAQLERVGAAEAALIRQALRRAEEFPGAQGEAILARAAEALCARLGTPGVAPAERQAFLFALLEATRRR